MANKVVTLTDVTLQMIYLFPVEAGILPVKANYTIVSDDSALFAGETFVTERDPTWASLPQNIKDALVLINSYMKTVALEDRGMA
jgi:hypothetical protein